MKTHKRAIRRRNNARLIQLRYKQEFSQRYASHNDDLAERQYWALLRARHRLDSSKMCHCGMCRNPRYNGGWPADGKLTMQEKVANDILSYGLDEYYLPETEDDTEVHDPDGACGHWNEVRSASDTGMEFPDGEGSESPDRQVR